jgi:hypothetical protein
MVVGGPIVSPCHSNRAMHAQTLGASRFDIIKLATKEYHVSMDSVSTLSKELIQQCGYGTIKATVEDVVVCFNDIIMVHHRVRKLWYNSYAHTMGPQVNKILSKSLSVFPKLTSSKVEDMVNFYDRLQEVSMNYAIALMPFDAVVLSNRFEGLCPPGLGLLYYAAMCKALMELSRGCSLVPYPHRSMRPLPRCDMRLATATTTYGKYLNSPFPALIPRSQSRLHCGRRSRTFFSLLRTTSSSFACRPSSTSITATVLGVVYLTVPCSTPNLLIPLCSFSHT